MPTAWIPNSIYKYDLERKQSTLNGEIPCNSRRKFKMSLIYLNTAIVPFYLYRYTQLWIPCKQWQQETRLTRLEYTLWVKYLIYIPNCNANTPHFIMFTGYLATGQRLHFCQLIEMPSFCTQKQLTRNADKARACEEENGERERQRQREKEMMHYIYVTCNIFRDTIFIIFTLVFTC